MLRATPPNSRARRAAQKIRDRDPPGHPPPPAPRRTFDHRLYHFRHHRSPMPVSGQSRVSLGRGSARDQARSPRRNAPGRVRFGHLHVARRRWIVHVGWLVELPGPRCPVAAWPAALPGRGRAVSAAEQGPHDLPGLAGRGVAPPVAERADDLQSAAGLGKRTGVSAALEPRYWGRRPRTADRVPAAAGRAGSSSRSRAWPEPGRACCSALVTSSDTTIAMSGLRSAAPHRRKVATVKSRAARTDPVSAPSVRVAICGRRAQPAGPGTGGGRQLPPSRPAVSAVSISQRQPVLPARSGRCAAIAVWLLSSRQGEQPRACSPITRPSPCPQA